MRKRRVAQVRADVESERLRRQRVEILGKRLPVPAQPGAHRCLRDVLDALHQKHEVVAVLRLARREPDAAVADHDRGHAVQVRRRAEGIPRDLRVEVGVDVDEAGCDQPAARIDLLAPRAVDRPDRGDAIAVDGDVALERRRARCRRRWCPPRITRSVSRSVSLCDGTGLRAGGPRSAPDRSGLGRLPTSDRPTGPAQRLVRNIVRPTIHAVAV